MQTGMQLVQLRIEEIEYRLSQAYAFSSRPSSWAQDLLGRKTLPYSKLSLMCLVACFSLYLFCL